MNLLTKEAMNFVQSLHKQFEPTRKRLLENRRLREGSNAPRTSLTPKNSETCSQARGQNWLVAAAPNDLIDRRVEITGPAEAKMIINGLNSGAQVFMADFEDALSPLWKNILGGQESLYLAIRRQLQVQNHEGKVYSLNSKTATLKVRPRGWHLVESNVMFDGEAVSASLFDFGIFFFHNAKELLSRKSGPYFYLPKMEGHLEARLWNDVFVFAQDFLGIPRGSIRATVLIETLPAAFEMEEILFELKEHASGLNAGRWDYLFSMIKETKNRDFVFPDRISLTMDREFLRNYTKQIVSVCHRHGAHAIGGMSAVIPSRKNIEFNEVAFARVRKDKQREAGDGFDGAWVAHPDLVPVVREVFESVLLDEPNQKQKGKTFDTSDFVPMHFDNQAVTEKGFNDNIRVAFLYLVSWYSGLGAVAIDNMMEDVATAEISRTQVWQWVHRKIKLDTGKIANLDLFSSILENEFRKLPITDETIKAKSLLATLVESPHLEEFLTLKGNLNLEKQKAAPWACPQFDTALAT